VDEIPEGVVLALRSGSCVAMVGAGISYPAGLPGFEGLLKAVAAAEAIPLKLPEGGSYDDLDKVQFDLAARVGKRRMCEVLLEKLYLKEPFPAAMQPVFQSFCRLPFAAVVSWNWDNLLDGRYDFAPNTASGFQQVLGSIAAPDSYETNQTPLLKMQGHLDSQPSVVLTRADYEARDAEALPFLRRLHETRTVLYIGMSLRPGGVGDERRRGSRHYAILNDVTPQRRRELREQWNIEAISFDSSATMWQGSQIIMDELAQRVYRVES